MIAETGDCPFCKAIMHHTRHAPTLPRDEITRADPCRATHADPLTGDESDDALLRMPLKEARAAAIDAFEERYVLHLLERTQHNVCKAAPLAGIDCNYLYRMRKKHSIARKE
jgi:DNA-binding NtrC family response regulator